MQASDVGKLDSVSGRGEASGTRHTYRGSTHRQAVGNSPLVTTHINTPVNHGHRARPETPRPSQPGPAPYLKPGCPPLTSPGRPTRRVGTAVAVRMDAVTIEFFFAVGVSAGSFFRLRPSDFSAPERPLLKGQSGRETSGGGVIPIKRSCSAP